MEINTTYNPEKKDWAKLSERPAINNATITSLVANILYNVKKNGDEAIKNYNFEFDKVVTNNLKVDAASIENAVNLIPKKLQNAIQAAADNIEKFHQLDQKAVTIETTPGVECTAKWLPIEKVGLYIPGGTAPLFSTVLMLGIPAKIAGNKSVSLCTPPDAAGNINPAILFAAQLAGIRNIYKVGGAQAIAAMAYGTDTIEKSDKIFGPGNQFVTRAKQLIAAEGIAIDMPAGPSEVLVVADASANPAFIAADLLSQAEHGPDSQVVLCTDSESLLKEVQSFLEEQIQELPRKEMAAKAISNSRFLVFKDIPTCMDFSNFYAPEHLIIQCQNLDNTADMVRHAGSVFLGPFTPESAGDYASGTNHTLPTNGFANAYSGVSTYSYMKRITFQTINKKGIALLGPTIEVMAEAEALMAHKNAVSIRLNYLKNA